jgi:toxin ParE1/3/4
MTASRLHYELSLEAEKDIEDIFDYSIYVSGFEETFEYLCRNPKAGRERIEIRDGLRSIVKESHVVFYRILNTKIRIARILHVSRDIIRFL